ncbi:MAG: hypothetical protein RLO17_02140 [Cyclobacteriaceae bacterium]
MEFIVNNIEILVLLHDKGLLYRRSDFIFHVNQYSWDDADRFSHVVLEQYVKNDQIRLLDLSKITYEEVYSLSEKYSRLRYVFYDFMTILACKKMALRLVTESSAMKMMAKEEGIKILPPRQMEEIVIRNIDINESNKILKKPDNL